MSVNRWLRRSIPLLAVIALIGTSRAQCEDGGAADEPKAAAKDTKSPWWTDAYTLGARTQLRPPNDWRTLQAGVNIFPISGPHRVEVAVNITFIGINPNKQTILQPGLGAAVTFRRIAFVGLGFSPTSGVRDKGYFFFGFSGLGIKDAIDHARPGTTPPAPPAAPPGSPSPPPPSSSRGK